MSKIEKQYSKYHSKQINKKIYINGNNKQKYINNLVISYKNKIYNINIY